MKIGLLIVGANKWKYSIVKSTFSAWSEVYLKLPHSSRVSLIEKSVIPALIAPNKTPEFFYNILEHHPKGVEIAMNLRSDMAELLNNIKSKQLKFDHSASSINECDNYLRKWLKAVFCLSSLRLRRIEFEASSGNVLQHVATGESVHRVRSLKELKRRLHDGRRCIGLFHECLPENPVVFIHIALTSQLARSLRYEI